MTATAHGPWEPWRMESDTVIARRIGPLTLWMEHRDDEFHLASQRGDEEGDETVPEKPEDLDWRRWICGTGAPRVVLEPRLPDRPVIVRPAMPVTILPGRSVDLFVSLPVRVAVRLMAEPGGTREDICEEPTVLLSNSWFGLPVQGELCYALKTRARRRLEDLRTAAHLAVCPLTVENAGPSALAFERLSIPVASLRVHAGAHHLWTSRGVLHYRGEETVPAIAFETSPPALDHAGDVLAEPRTVTKQNLARRVLGSVRAVTRL